MMGFVRRVWGIAALVVIAALCAVQVQAQDAGDAFVQVEAQPTLDKAMERARAYAADFPDVQGFRVSSGWYAIVLGPMTSDQAAERLVSLRAQNRVPQDSFLTVAGDLGARFWPVGDQGAAAVEVAPAEPAAVQPEAPAEPEAPLMVEETRDEALAAEAALSQDERARLQDALQWYGFYKGALDGAIGKGSRASMAAWQEAKGYEPTGVLTTIQRAELVGAWTADKAEFGFDTVTDAESGIEVILPLGLVEFDGYAPPFVQYREKAGSGLTIRLISEPGDAAALAGLYQVLQTLDVMPPTGERALDGETFTLRGDGADLSSLAWARAEKGAIKGALVTWTPALADKIDRILPVIQSSLRSNGAKALDPGLVPLDEAVRRGLLAGLEAKQPKASQSGIFVTADGAVVTAAAGLAQCGRVTIEREYDAVVAASDAASGLVLLKPSAVLAPPAFAHFAAGLPTRGTQVTAVGWSYGDRLPAPVLNPGLLEATQGLDGSAGQLQLALDVLPGDAGGPVLDAAGGLVGLVLPGPAKGPALPQGVALAAGASTVAGLMAQAQIAPAASMDTAPVTPDVLQATGLGMTALVSCWE